MGNTLEITEARKQLNCLDERLREDRVIVVTKHNRKAFAVVDLQYLASLLQMVDMFSNPDAMRELRKTLAVET
jgi:PHD/YefM family antitoxin component YafN of YafNO toxin-antitoxin module